MKFTAESLNLIFANKKMKKYLPFLNIARINARDRHTNGNLKAILRLLKTLGTDSEDKINLRDSEINAILYNMDEIELTVPQNKVLSLLPKVSQRLAKLTNDTNYFNQMLSPSGMDKVFGTQPEKQNEIMKLNELLNVLIEDLKKDLDSTGKSLNSEIAYLEG